MRVCTQTYTYHNGVSEPCGREYKRCLEIPLHPSSFRDHDESDRYTTPTVHRDWVDNSPPGPTPAPEITVSPLMHPCEIHDVFSILGLGLDHSAASCDIADHYNCDGATHEQAQCPIWSTDGQCTHTYWACLHPVGGSSHNHQYPVSVPDPAPEPDDDGDDTDDTDDSGDSDCPYCVNNEGCSACQESSDGEQEIYKVCTRWVYRWIWNDLEDRWDYVYEVCGGEFTDNSNVIGDCTLTEAHQE